MNTINKWKNGLIPGILMHIALGLIFTWTILNEKISEFLGYDCSWLYPVSMIGMGISCVVFGYFIDKCIRCSSKLCLILYIFGLSFLILSLYFKIIPLLILGSVVLGFSLGFMLLVPIKNILLWFSTNKGLAIGTSLTMFGLFRGISSFLVLIIFKDLELFQIIAIMGSIGLIPLVISVCITKFPINIEKCNIKVNNWSKSIIKVISIKELYTYWTVLFFGIVSGYSLLSYKSSLIGTLKLEHLMELFLILGAMFNIIGRLGTGAWADKINNKNKLISFILYISSLVCILGFIWSSFIPVTIILCSMLYGALITIMPLSLENHYGSEKIGRSMGFVFSAITTGGIAGHYFSITLSNFSETIFQTVLLCFGVLYAIGLYLSSDLLLLGNKLPAKNPQDP